MANEYSEERRIKLPTEIIHQSSLLAANILSWDVTNENPSVILAKMAKQWNSYGNSLIILIRNDGRVQITSNCVQWQLNGKSVNKKHVENFFTTIERASNLLLAHNQSVQTDIDGQIAESDDLYDSDGEKFTSIKSDIIDTETPLRKALLKELSSFIDVEDFENLTVGDLLKIKQLIPLMKNGDSIVKDLSNKKIVKMSKEQWRSAALDNSIWISIDKKFTVLYQI